MHKFVSVLSVVLLLVIAADVNAAQPVAITGATGGSAISANTTGGTYTSLTGPILAEGGPGGIAAGTLILNAPTGIMFDTSSAVTVGVASGAGSGPDIVLESTNAVVTTSTITINVVSPSSNSRRDTLTFKGIKVRPSTGRATSGNITRSGTAVMLETTNNYGTLAVIAGTVSKMWVVLPGETFTNSLGNTGTVSTQNAGTNFNITSLIAIDAYTNLVSTYTGAKTISYSGPGGTPTYTTSVTFSGGISTTTLATTLRRAETTTIAATDGTLTGIASSPITVTAGVANRLQILLPGETINAGSTTGKTGTPTATAAFSPVTATVNLADAYWNPLSTSSDTVHFSSTDSLAVLPSDTALVNGTGSFSITFKTRTNNTSVTVSDVTSVGVTTSTSTAITVTNNPPTLNSVNTLTGAFEDTAFTISYATLLAQTSLTDVDVNPADTIGFRVESISSGTLTQSGTNVVAGTTFLRSSTTPLVWRGAANANGTLNAFTVRAHDGTAFSAGTAQVSVLVSAVNDAPSFTKGANQTVLEDSGTKTVSGWATAISAGPSDESAQTVSFIVSNNNTNLFSTQPAVSSAGTLTFTLATNANGSATVTISAQDDGGTANSGTDSSAAQTFTITVTAVNDAPTFVKGSDISVAEDSGAASYSSWATSINAGATDESAQTLTFTVSNNNNALFSSQPAISSSGTLTFTPAANAHGTATVTVFLKDNGGVLNSGADTSASQTFTIEVLDVNDAPSFTKGADQTVLEDSSARTVAAWATSISKGPSNESGQTVSFNVSNNNNSLFAVQPAVASNGTLTFTPAANANGTAVISVSAQDNGGTDNGGSDTSAVQTFNITITAVNDAPSFVKGANVSVLEDSGAQSLNGWATAISAGPADESTQTLTFTATNNNAALFSVQPAVAADGTLTFTPAGNVTGSATVTLVLRDNGGTNNSGADTSGTQVFSISVTGVNDAPTINTIANATILEDSGIQSVTLTGISTGLGEDQELQSITNFVATADNTNVICIISVGYTNQNSTAVLRYKPVTNATGTATITVTLQDDGGTANGGVDTATTTFNVTVTPVNDAPSFTKGTNVLKRSSVAAQSIANWATAISAGPTNESSQTVTFHVSNNNPTLFLVQPAISSNGTLTFTPLTDGTATVSVYLQDNGGTANGGSDQSAIQTFTIDIYPINVPPTFTMATNLAVLEDAGTQTINSWLTDISSGSVEEVGQNVTITVTNDNNSLFSTQPSISAAGVLSFTPAPNAYGSAVVTVALQDDGGTLFGGSDISTQTFTLTITAVNDTPAFTKGLDIALGINSSRSQSIGAWATSITPGINETAQTFTFLVTNDTPEVFVQQPSIAADGTLTFAILPTATNVLATVSVQLKDNGGSANGGSDTSVIQTFRIALSSTYGTPTTLATGQGPTGLYLGNLRGLTFPGATKSAGPRFRDMIVANFIDGTVTVRFCNDDGTFTAPTVYPVGLNPFGVTSADLDKDGFEEIIAANSGTNTITVLHNKTDRTFEAGVNYQVGASSNPGPIAVTKDDFNGDGRLDIAVANSVDNNVSVLLGAGAGTLGTSTNFAVGSEPMSIWIGDLNGDKKSDILTANKTANTLSILPGRGDGSFGAAQTITLFPGGNPQPTYASPFDVNGDGKLDIIVANYGSNTVSVLLAQGNGTFQISSNYTVGINPRSVLVRDLDRDGKLDIAVANSGSASVSILHNRGDGIFEYAGSFSVGSNPLMVWGSNFDSDDATDLAISNYGDNSVSILRYNGPLAYNAQVSLLEDHSMPITLAGRILNDESLNFAIVTQPTNGVLTGTGKNVIYTPNTNFNGTDAFKYQVSYTSSGLILESASAVVTLKVVPVNDAPSFVVSGNLVLTNFNVLQTNIGFVTAISPGAANEAGQQLTFAVTTTNSTLFDIQPKISSAGTLTYRPAPNKSGTAYLAVRLTDNGGVVSGGTNGSSFQTFRINIEPNPVIALKGNYSGLFYESTGVAINSAGYFNLSLSDRRVFSGRVLLSGKSYTISGTFAPNGLAHVVIPRTNQSALNVSLALNLVGAPTDQMTGSITDGSWTADMFADRNVFNAVTNPAPTAGRYTMAFGGNPGNASKPSGDGLGMVVVKTDGTASLSGVLADGTTIVQLAPLSKNGAWPFYASLYSGKGLIMGWVNFANTTDSDLEGDVSWIKTDAAGGKYYPAGFTNDIVTVGSLYRVPSIGHRVLGLTNASVELRDGNLSRALTNKVTLGTNNVITVSSNTNSLALTVTTTTGSMSGGFVNPQTKVRNAVRGIVLQKQNAAYGFFLGTNKSGLFILHP